MDIPFNQPYMVGRELDYIAEAHARGHLSGDGQFTKRCHAWLEQRIGCSKALLTHSCTAALEMSALLLDLQPGDEVIMPSFTFVSTANAFVLRGAIPVFVDVCSETLNLNHELIEEAITPRTRAICVVHYAGVSCAMDPIMAIAERHGIKVIEDAAQAIMSSYKGRPLGSIGHLGALSFHETKNVQCGEGGALLINDPSLAERAEIIREKGTNRSKFFRGQIDKYTWVDVGSSYLPSEILAAFLFAQLEAAEAITARRLAIWANYQRWIERREAHGNVRGPRIPAHCKHNAHMYYVLTRSLGARTALLDTLKAQGIGAVFHYVPLHSTPQGLRCSRTVGSLPVTAQIAERLIRLPLWPGLELHQERVLDVLDRHIA